MWVIVYFRKVPYLLLVVYSGNLHRCSDWYLSTTTSSRRKHAALKRCTTLSEWVTTALCTAPLPEWQARQAGNSGQVAERVRGQRETSITDGRRRDEWTGSHVGRASVTTVDGEGRRIRVERAERHPDSQREMGRSWPREIPFPPCGRKRKPTRTSLSQYNQYSDIPWSIDACQTEVGALLNVYINN